MFRLLAVSECRGPWCASRMAQSAHKERLGLLKIALGMVEARQVVRITRGIQMLCSLALLTLVVRPLQKRLCFRVAGTLRHIPPGLMEHERCFAQRRGRLPDPLV